MDKFGSVELRLNKDVQAGDKESLLSLFDADARFEPIELLTDSEEDSTVKVVLQELGEVDLKLGAEMVKGRKKTIMTLFWFSERSKPIEMKRNAKAGERVVLNLFKQ